MTFMRPTHGDTGFNKAISVPKILPGKPLERTIRILRPKKPASFGQKQLENMVCCFGYYYKINKSQNFSSPNQEINVCTDSYIILILCQFVREPIPNLLLIQPENKFIILLSFKANTSGRQLPLAYTFCEYTLLSTPETNETTQSPNTCIEKEISRKYLPLKKRKRSFTVEDTSDQDFTV
eukprot:Gb_09234 [translate_table: standard]